MFFQHFPPITGIVQGSSIYFTNILPSLLLYGIYVYIWRAVILPKGKQIHFPATCYRKESAMIEVKKNCISLYIFLGEKRHIDVDPKRYSHVP